ncbi:uncharacterized protein LOC141847923 [Curcuma longa]|uniref:uncharacterized protein LOC141847923 n=1 Tax=Curcuma longa TaxID=136217 RepID=UPI003D9FA995
MAPPSLASCNLSSPTFLFHLGACKKLSLPLQLISLRSSPRGRYRFFVDRGMQSSSNDEGRKASSVKRWRTYSGDLIGGSGASVPPANIPVWVGWALGSLVILAIPFYKRIFTEKGDEIEKVAEDVMEAVEKVAEVTERVASDVADALPDGVGLKDKALLVEKIAHEVEKDVKLVEAIAHQVDHVKEEVEALVKPAIDGEEKTMEKDDQEQRSKDDQPN